MSGITRFILLFTVTVFLGTAAEARETKTQESKPFAYRGFVGGMMLHTGYVYSGDIQVTSQTGDVHKVTMAGTPYGIGGAVRFMFGRHLRVGTEGYVSNLTYGKYDSYAKTGWGGLLADCAWETGICRFFIGGTIGGGSQANTVKLSPTGNDYKADDIAYRKYSFAALAPFAGIEIRLTQKVDMTIKADWLLNISGKQKDFISGPRIYIGVMFGHKK